MSQLYILICDRCGKEVRNEREMKRMREAKILTDPYHHYCNACRLVYEKQVEPCIKAFNLAMEKWRSNK